MTRDPQTEQAPSSGSFASEQDVELYVRRLLERGELRIREEISGELREQREFLGKQVGFLVKTLGLILLVCGGFFTWAFGKDLESISSQIEREVDSRVIEYAIAEDYKERLDQRLRIIINSDKVKRDIESAIRGSLKRDIDGAVADSLSAEIADLSDDKVEDILLRAYGNQLKVLQIEIRSASDDVAILHAVLDKNLDDEVSQALLDGVESRMSPILLRR